MLQDLFNRIDTMPPEQYIAWLALAFFLLVILNRVSELKWR